LEQEKCFSSGGGGESISEIVTTERRLSAEEFLNTKLDAHDNLGEGELVKEIRVPREDGVAHYDKSRVRDAIDFAVVSLADRFDIQNGMIPEESIAFGGVSPVPYRAVAKERTKWESKSLM